MGTVLLQQLLRALAVMMSRPFRSPRRVRQVRRKAPARPEAGIFGRRRVVRYAPRASTAAMPNTIRYPVPSSKATMSHPDRRGSDTEITAPTMAVMPEIRSRFPSSV